MDRLCIVWLLGLLFASCSAQTTENRKVGGPCEGCEALYEFGDAVLNAVDTLVGFERFEPRLHLKGTVFEADGETPAKDVIIYIYHTDRDGIYKTEGNESGWAKRHGMFRGWVKTDENGRYDFYTFRPASYPNTRITQHIHMTIKEPDTNPYYIDNVEFTDDPFFRKKEIRKSRGGSGVVTPSKKTNELTSIERDIILGLNIPDY